MYLQSFFPAGPPQGSLRRPDSFDDKHVISRHAAIYPKESELQAVQKIVSHTEKALKFVSDQLLSEADKKPTISEFSFILAQFRLADILLLASS